MPSATTRGADYRLHVAEPRAAYVNRPPLVTDASVIAAALFGEGGRAEATALLHGRTLHAPHLLDHEIASVGLKKLRREGLPAAVIAAALQAYARLPIERHAVDVEALVIIAERYGLTAYDAAYLYVAEQLTAPLATLDDKLAAAAHAYLTTESQIHEPA
jgi:predicted nucleic acid-binding protein